MAWSDVEIDRVKRDARLFEMISAETTLRKTGNCYAGRCPFPAHGDKNASFNFYPNSNSYHCHSTACGESGSVIDWMLNFRGAASFNDAMKMAGGDEGEIVQHILEERRMEAETRKEVEKKLTAKAAENGRIAAKKIWNAGIPIVGTLTELYLREGRGLGYISMNIPVLLFAPDLKYWVEISKDNWQIVHRGPAMLAAFQRPNGTFAAVHQTWLSADGYGKAMIKLPNGSLCVSKKIRGPYMGASIRLSPHAHKMGAGEGIETCLSAIKHGLPTWCAGTLGNLTGRADRSIRGKQHPENAKRTLSGPEPDMASARMFMPELCDHEVVIRDSDTRDLYELDARLTYLKKRNKIEGRTTRILAPPDGMDLNDWMTKRRVSV